MIWGAILIPLIAALIMLTWFRRKITWWELAIPLFASILLIGISHLSIDYLVCRDIEYWTTYVERAEYYEPWNELRLETYTETVRDSNGNTRTELRTRWVVVHHPAHYKIIDSSNTTFNINATKFKDLCQKFGNCQFKKLNRSYHTLNGDAYISTWDSNDNNLISCTTTHQYKNKILASRSVFKFRDISEDEKQQYELYDYPEGELFNTANILGDGGPTHNDGESKLDVLNAKLGAEKQIRIWMLIFKDQPLDAAIAQQSYWQGGNKNELILCIGLDQDTNIQWGYVFSWCENEKMKVEIRDSIITQQKLNLPLLIDNIKPKIIESWQRKEFNDFNYLTVEWPWWTIILTYGLTIIINLGLVILVIKNDINCPKLGSKGDSK